MLGNRKWENKPFETPKSQNMTLEQIRCNIEKDSVGMLYSEDIIATIKAIEAFKTVHHYLPNDIDEWYDYMYDIYVEQQEDDYNAFMEQGGDWEG